jgi:hypothetical protein
MRCGATEAGLLLARYYGRSVHDRSVALRVAIGPICGRPPEHNRHRPGPLIGRRGGTIAGALIVVVALIAGFVLGLLLRWWGLAAAVAFGVWIVSTTEVDAVPEWFLGLGYAVCVSIGVALGTVGRRALDSA